MGRKKDNGSDIAAYIILFVIAAPIFLIWGLFKLIVMICEASQDAKYKKQLKENIKVNRAGKKISKSLNVDSNINLKTDKLDIYTIDFITRMIADTEKKSIVAYKNGIMIIDLNEMLLDFLKDIDLISGLEDFEKLYTSSYYKKKVKKYFGNNKVVLNKMTEDYTLSVTGDEIDTICETMKKYTEIKLKTTYLQLENENIYGICDKGYLCTPYQLVLDYLTDALTTCTCIAKMLFIDKKVREIDEKNEFFTILSNMSKEINDVELISKKTRPLYEEFYKQELGNIESDVLYTIFVELIVNKANNEETSEETEEKFTTIQEFDSYMEEWTTELAREDKKANIYKCVLKQIKNKINPNDFNLFITALKQAYKYAGLYNYNVKHSEKIDMRERYLNGDFLKEKEEINERYNFNNISTGTQFELYLTDLFKKLGYKTVHNGKAGDQGADLILKKGNYTYAVQAKFYTDKLSNTPIQEIVGALKYYNANQGVVITNSTFTKGAKDLAIANNVILIDGEKLNKLVEYIFEENNDEDILQKFIKQKI